MPARSTLYILSIFLIVSQELPGPFFSGMVDNLPGIPLLHNDAAIHKDNLIRDISGESHLMGDNNHGGFLFCQSPDNPQNFAG